MSSLSNTNGNGNTSSSSSPLPPPPPPRSCNCTESVGRIFELMVEINQDQQREFIAKRRSFEESMAAQRKEFFVERNSLQDTIDSLKKQLEDDRKSFQKVVDDQHEEWAARDRVLREQLEKMKMDCKTTELTCARDVAKANLLLSMETKKAVTYKKKYEDAEDERNDYKTLYEELASCLSEPNYEGLSEQERCKALENDVTRLQIENARLRPAINSDVTDLLPQREFAWTQFHEMEDKLNDQITKIMSEAELANEKISKLQTRLEESQSSITEKDSEIVGLKGDLVKLKDESIEKSIEIARLESDLLKKSEEISKLSNIEMDTEISRLKSEVAKLESDSFEKNKEIAHLESKLLKKSEEITRLSKLLGNSPSDSASPVCCYCTVESGHPSLQGTEKELDGVNVTAEKNLHHSGLLHEGSRGLKRKAVEAASNKPELSSSGTTLLSTLEDSKLTKRRKTAATPTLQSRALRERSKRIAGESASSSPSSLRLSERKAAQRASTS